MGRRRKKKSNPRDYLSLPEFNLSQHARRSILLLIVLVFSAISFLGLFNLAGHFGEFVAEWLKLIFGYGQWLIPLIFLYWALLIVRRIKSSLKFTDYLGLFLFFISYQTLFHFFINPLHWKSVAAAGRGGGYLGFYLSKLFFYLFGFWGGVAVLFTLLLIALVLILNTSLARIIGRESWLAKILDLLRLFFRNLFSDTEEENSAGSPSENEGQKYVSEAREEILDAWQEKTIPAKLEKVTEEQESVEDDNEEKHSLISAITKKNRPTVQEKIIWPKRNIKIDMPLELLNNKFSKAHGGDIAANRLRIQQTLEKFGIEVEMGESKVGPTVTQYTFRPAAGIKLSRITTLSNDLSLALAAHPIRIEAPIPGKSLVGIEVPNHTKAIVGLREILEDDNFKKRQNNLYLALGKDVSGTAWLYNLARMPHLLVAGATNSGKSVCLNSIIVSLLYQNNPADLRFIMVDPKRVELPVYNGIPHLLTPVITDANKTINALRWCLNEMERRYDVLSKAHKRNIQSYNASSSERLPYIVFIIDELADFMMTSGKDMEAAIIRLAQMSRAIGIHLILATQRPSVDVITGLIKANIPTRIAFSVASLVDSKTILDSSGAEKLLGRGDMLFMSPEFSKPKRIQGAYLSDEEINDVVNYIKEQSGPADYLEGITDRQKVSGNAGVGLDGNHGDEDELFEAAQALIVKARKASTSMLQRRLSIGYGRAAKILDMLEEEGIIGPSNGSKPREVFLTLEQYEARANGGLSSIPIHDRKSSIAPDSYLNQSAEDVDEEDNVLVFKKSSESDQTVESPPELADDSSESPTSSADRQLGKEEVLDTKNEKPSSSEKSTKIGDEEDSDSDDKEDLDSNVSHPLDDNDEMFFAK